jgi:hypothetical protein
VDQQHFGPDADPDSALFVIGVKDDHKNIFFPQAFLLITF